MELQIQGLLGVSGGEESLPSKIYEFLMLGRVESLLGRERESREERGAAVVKGVKVTVYPDPPRYI